MTSANKDIDKVLDQLVASTRSPRGRFSARNSWRILEKRLFPVTGRRKFLRIAGSVAASLLIGIAGWYAYDFNISGNTGDHTPRPVRGHAEPLFHTSLSYPFQGG